MPDSVTSKIGELLVQEGLLAPEQLEHAVTVQQSQTTYVPLGQVCVTLRLLSRLDLERVLRKYRKRIRLGDLLTNLGIATQEQVEDAVEQQERDGKRLGAVLVEMGAISEAALVDALSVQLGIPKVAPVLELIDRGLLEGLSLAFLEKHEVLPAFKDSNAVTVILADPLNDELLQQLERIFGFTIQPAIATGEEIRTALRECARLRSSSTLSAAPNGNKDLVIGKVSLSRDDPDNVVGIVNYVISSAILEGASDIHIEPHETRLRVRFRIDGVLLHRTDLPASLAAKLTSRIKVLCGLDISERRRHQDGRIEARVMNKEVDLRVSTYVTVYGESIVIRILHRRTALIEVEALGFSPVNARRYAEILNYPSGVILVTGPTGSGKTTTLYASLNYLNNRARKIITVEDPVEYTLEGVIQGRLEPKLGLTYIDFLKSMMRQDPDVIMVGEIRDEPAAEAVIQAALTGHKVLSTFHTDDSIGALLRLMDMGIETFLISSTVVSVVAQRLVRTLCPRCRERATPAAELVAAFHVYPEALEQYTFYAPRGCSACNRTGFKGRTAIHELLVMNDDIRDAILARQPSTEIRRIARDRAGLVAMREDAFYKATRGVTTLEEAVRVVHHNEADDLASRSPREIIALCEGNASGTSAHQPVQNLVKPV